MGQSQALQPAPHGDLGSNTHVTTDSRKDSEEAVTALFALFATGPKS
jgi:hypothetical protein